MNSKDSIEMKEIKVSKGKALLKFLGRHIVVVYLVVILAILLFGNIAKAEEMASNVKEEVEQLFYRYDTTHTYQSYLNQAMSECPYFMFVSWGQDNIGVFYFASVDNNSIAPNDSRWWVPISQTDWGGYQGWKWTSPNDTSGAVYYAFAFWGPGSGAIGIKKLTSRGIIEGDMITGYSTTLKSGGTNISWQTNTYAACGTWKWHNISKPQTIEPISYVEDDRLKFWTVNELDGSKTLVTVLDGFMQGTEGVMVNEFSNVVLTYELDNVEHTLALNSTNSTIRQSGTATSYKIETPFDAFGFDSQTSIFRITKCDFTQTYSAYGYTTTENYKISCDYVAYKESSPVEPAVIPTPPTIYDDPAKPIDISDREYDFFQQLQSSVSGGDIDYVNEYPVLPTWANVYELNTFFQESVDRLHIYQGSVIMGKYLLDSNYDFDLKAFIYDNAHSQFYDVIIIRLDQTDWPTVINASTLPDSQAFYGYVVLYTDSYYLRLDAETQFNILEALQLDANQQLVNWTWLVTKLDDFELKTLDRLNAQLDVETESLSWLKTIDNSIKAIDPFDDSSILDVLYNIYDAITGIGGTDTSGIESKLDTLINHFIANNSQENTAYKQFVTWLRDANGKPVQYVSTGYEFFTELFDYFPFTRDLDGSGGFANMFDMGKGFIDLSTGHTTGIPTPYQSLSYYFNSANDGTYNVSSMSGR